MSERVVELPSQGARTSAPEFERTPPQDIPAEQSVLGGMLLSKDAIADVVEVVRATDFYKPAHQTIFDVVVDLRRGSPTFGEWEGFELDDTHGHQLWIPVGFGHGFCVLSDVADFVYKCTNYYDPATESGIRFDDPGVGIAWPMPEDELLFSQRGGPYG